MCVTRVTCAPRNWLEERKTLRSPRIMAKEAGRTGDGVGGTATLDGLSERDGQGVSGEKWRDATGCGAGEENG